MSENESTDDSADGDVDPIEEIANRGSGDSNDEPEEDADASAVATGDSNHSTAKSGAATAESGESDADPEESTANSGESPTDSTAKGSRSGATVDLSSVPDVDDRAIDAEHDAREIVAEVADTGADAAAGVVALVERIAELEVEHADLEGKLETVESQLKRKQADFENYKKRAKREQERVQEQAAADLIERLLEVRDDLARALEDAGEDEDTIQEGVRMTLSEFDRILDAEGVDRIEVEPGERVDPEHHEVIARVDGDTEPGTIDEQHRPGYRMHGSVLREAQVTVTDEDG